MDTSTLLFAAGIVGAVVLIVLGLSYTSIRQRRKEADKHENYFTRAAGALGISINKKEFLQNRMIGLDELQRRLMFIDNSKQPVEPVLIELNEITDSRLMVNNDTVVEKVRGEDKVTDIFISSVKIRLQFKSKQMVPADLTFYKYGVDSIHDLEHLKQVAGSWNDLINEKSG
ncbi:MAG TPA: hypothetical protein PKC54_16295 [Ferruginibacter sp.]|nr:hypothetical protein [Ferruginibacter sp.]